MVSFENKLILVVAIISVVLNCVELFGTIDEFLKSLSEFVWKKVWTEINLKYYVQLFSGFSNCEKKEVTPYIECVDPYTKPPITEHYRTGSEDATGDNKNSYTDSAHGIHVRKVRPPCNVANLHFFRLGQFSWKRTLPLVKKNIREKKPPKPPQNYAIGTVNTSSSWISVSKASNKV